MATPMVTGCAEDSPGQSPGGPGDDGVAGAVAGDGLVYENPVSGKPAPSSTLERETPVVVLCKAPRPGETLEHSEAVMSVFYRIAFDGGAGYTRQHDVRLTNSADYADIPAC